MVPAQEILKSAKKWYLEGASIRKVAKLIQEKYGIKVGKETVRGCLSKVVKLRSKKEVMTLKRGNPLDGSKIVELYTKKLLSMKQIAEISNASASGIKWVLLKNRIEPRTKREGLKIRIGKYEKLPFNGTEEEKAYLIGITLGDLHVRRNSNFTIEVNTSTTREAMINLLVDTFEKHTDGVVWYPDGERGFRFYAYLDNSFEFLIKVKKNIEIIKDFRQNEFISFLAGFFDAEGCIVKRKHRENFRCVIKIGNTNKQILEIIKEKLENLGMHPKLYLYSKVGKYHYYNNKKFVNRKPYYALEICRVGEILQLLNELNLKHEEKIARKFWVLNSPLYNSKRQ